MAAFEDPDLKVFLRRDSERPAGPRSYLSDGRGVVWDVEPPPGWRVAVDAERVGEQVPPHVRARSRLPEEATSEQVLLAWTQAEVMAKLTGVPILLRVREHGLRLADLADHQPVALRSLLVDDMVVTVGATGRRSERVGE